VRRAGRRILPRFRDIRLFWKLLVPFFVLLLLLGVAGVVVIVRSLAVRADAEMRSELSGRAVDVAVLFRDQEQGLLDSVTIAANFVGLPEAIRARSSDDVDRFARTALSVGSSLRILVTTDAQGTALVQLDRGPDGSIRSSSGRSWVFADPVREALREEGGRRRSGLVPVGGSVYLVTVGPVVDSDVVGTVLVGVAVDEIVQRAADRTKASVALYDGAGRGIAAAGTVVGAQAEPFPSRPTLRRARVDGEEVATLFAPLELAGGRSGGVAVTVPVKPFHAAVRDTGMRLAVVLALAMLVVIAIGAALSRLILGQVRPLVATNRLLAEGDLSARVPVVAGDELGEVAAGLNDMAAKLQASYEDLERRVEERTTQLRDANEQLERAAEAQAEFFTSMAHEFRAPLFAIIGHADMMQDPHYTPRGAGKVSAFGSTIQGAGEHVLGLVNEILDIAKLEAGQARLLVESVPAQAVIDEVLTEMRPLVVKAKLQVIDRTPDQLPQVAADRTALKAILLNLISNAIKYTPDRGVITISARRSGRQVEIAVEDTGIGIPAKARLRIFDPFFQVSDERARHGQASSGLGLALTRRLVEALGGTIRLAAVRKGAKFVFTLPVANELSPVPPQRAASRLAH